MRLAYAPYMLHFRKPAGTSRGVLYEKPTCLLKIWDESDPSVFGIGEAALFPGLSPEAGEKFGLKVLELLSNIAIGWPTDLRGYSSIQFGLEQALRDYASGGKRLYYNSDFITGKSDILINGLIWMGSYDEMQNRIEEKLEKGFSCIKIKVGAINWDSEIKLIENIRRRFSSDSLQIRVDANGAFTIDNVFSRLNQLASLKIHSIEQPIKSGNTELMSLLCSKTPLPIALDEELIGIYDEGQMEELLDFIKPQYIILKPALCGGFSGAENWISAANRRNIGWWVTSALESNIGLNAIAQWVSTLNVKTYQGLGTGMLYENNFSSPIYLNGEHLRYNSLQEQNINEFDILDWHE